MDIHYTHYFDTDPDGFERLMDDPAVIAEQVRRMNHLRERRVTRLEENGRLRYRTVEFVLKQKLPGGKPLILTEESVYDMDAKEFRYTVRPSSFGKLVTTTGSYRLFAEGPHRTRREIDVTVKVKIPGAERLMEPVMVKSSTKNMESEMSVIHEILNGELTLEELRAKYEQAAPAR